MAEEAAGLFVTTADEQVDGEEPKVKMGDNLRLKLSEERLHDLGRAEERPKLQTPRVSTRFLIK